MVDSKIESLTITEEVSYRDESLHHFWEQIEMSGTDRTTNQLEVVEQIHLASQMVCIMTSEELPAEVIYAIQAVSQRGVRVYLLSDRLYPSYRDSIVGKSLIRTGQGISGTVLLIDPGVKGRETGMIGSASMLTSEDPIKVALGLSINQIKETYQYFIWKFWKVAELEYMDAEDSQSPRSVLEAPFDVYPLLSADSLIYQSDSQMGCNDWFYNYLESAEQEIILVCGGVNNYPDWMNLLFLKMRQGLKVKLYIKLERKSHPFIQSLAENGAEVYGYPDVGNDLVLVDGDRGLIVNYPLFNEELAEQKLYGFRLDANGVRQVQTVLNGYQTINRWKYFQEKKLGDVQSSRILFGNGGYEESDAVEVTESSTIDLGELIAPTLRDLQAKQVKPELKAEGYVKQAQYQWTVLPKVRDEKGRLDNLYNQWDSEVQSFQSYLTNLKALANYAEEKKSSLTNFSMAKMARFFLGKSQAVKKLMANVDQLLAEIEGKNTFSTQQWTRYIDTANEWAQEIKVTRDEIDMKIDESVQEQKWNETKTKLEEQIADINNSIQAVEAEKAKLSEDTTDSYVEKQEELKQLEEQHEGLIKELEAFEENNRQQIDSLKQKEKVLQLFAIVDEGIKKLGKTKKKKVDHEYKNIEENLANKIAELFDNTTYIEETVNQTNIKEKKDLLGYIKIEIVNHPLFTYEKEIDTTLKAEYNEKTAAIEESDKQLNKVKKDIEVVQQVVHDKLNKEDKKIEKLEMDKRKVHEELMKMGSTFKYQPPEPKAKGDESLKSVLGSSKGKGKNKNKNTKEEATSSVDAFQSKAPTETLPAIGTLYHVSGERQLAIQTWNELEVGEKEAARLKAELVVERDETIERS